MSKNRCSWIAALALLASCNGGAGQGGDAPTSLSAGGVLIGGGRCQAATTCESGVCSLGHCLGYLMATTDSSREEIGPAVAEAAKDRAIADTMALTALEVLGDAVTDRFARARAADLYRWLPAAKGLAALPPFLDDPDEAVRFFVARALHALGDARGTEVLRGFDSHRSEAVRELARLAL